jgi:hypothetical protein
VRERLDPYFAMSSSQGMMSVGLVIVRAMVIIVPLVVAFVVGMILFLATVLYAIVHVLGMNDVGPSHTHPEKAISCWPSPRAGSGDGWGSDLTSSLLGQGLGPSIY